MRAVWVLVIAAGCGRLGFDAVGGGTGSLDDAGVVPFDIAFDAPLACLPASVPTSCTKNGGVTAISAGTVSTCGIHAGGITCWGDNTNGELGFCDSANVLVPIASFGFPAAQVAV